MNNFAGFWGCNILFLNVLLALLTAKRLWRHMDFFFSFHIFQIKPMCFISQDRFSLLLFHILVAATFLL